MLNQSSEIIALTDNPKTTLENIEVNTIDRLPEPLQSSDILLENSESNKIKSE